MPGDLPGSVEEIAEEYLREIRRVQHHGPYHLLGWSFGGVVAHEIAVQLQDHGEEVRFLGLMDAYPAFGGPRTRVSHEEVLGMMIELPESSEAFDGSESSFDRDDVVKFLRENDQVLATFEEPKVFSLVDAAVNHVLVMSSFTPRFFDGDAIFFRAMRGKMGHGAEVWNHYVNGRVTVYDIDSTHMGMTAPEPLAEIGDSIARHIEPGKNSD